MLQFLLGRALRGGPDDDPAFFRRDLLQYLLEPVALGVRQLAADPGHRGAWDIHQIPPRQADLAGQARALVADRVLGDLDHNRLAGLERRFDPLRDTLEAARVEVDFAGIQDRVATLADVDEGRLHRGQHVLHLAEVDVAHKGLVTRLVHVVLDQDPVLEHGDLGPVALLAHHHDPLDGFSAGQELRFADDRRPAPSGVASLAPALPLGLEPGGTLDRPDVVGLGCGPGLTNVHYRVGRLVGCRHLAAGHQRAVALPAPPAAPAR